MAGRLELDSLKVPLNLHHSMILRYVAFRVELDWVQIPKSPGQENYCFYSIGKDVLTQSLLDSK